MDGGFGDLNGAGLEKFRGEAKSVVNGQNQLKTVAATDCNVDWLRLDIPIDSALVFRQQEAVTAFKRQVDVYILEQKESGVLDRWGASGLPSSKCSATGSLSSGGAMPFEGLAGVFLIVGCFSAVTVVFSVLKFLYERHAQQQQSMKVKMLPQDAYPPPTEEEGRIEQAGSIEVEQM